MDHTHIVQASDLERYADTRDSEAVIPELLYLLVRQSVSNASVCKIPYGKTVNLPGWDGIVEAETLFPEFVPEGRSYWEVGTGVNPNEKATAEFKKRTSSLPVDDRGKASFVFVTPRFRGWSEPDQALWIGTRKSSGWKDVRIIDGVTLANWLREFPAIGRWMAKRAGLSTGLSALTTPSEHWEIIRDQAKSKADPRDPPLPSQLFIEGRGNACVALEKLFEGTSDRLLLFAESNTDVADFVAAYIETLDEETSRNYAYRCLFVSEEDAWRSVVETRKRHVLIGDPWLGLDTQERADLQTIATRKGHAVVVPLCGIWAQSDYEIIKMKSPPQSQIETVLINEGYSEERSRELGRIGGDQISALRRHLQGLGSLPPYGTWETARLICQAGLVGRWDGTNPEDRKALEKLLGKGYGDWIKALRPDTLRSDSPLIQMDEKWRFVARGEAWKALGPRVTDDDLDRFQETTVVVLGETDPKFDLPHEERITASIYGKELKYSRFLREGLAETLALVGSRAEALSSCSLGKAETTAVKSIRRLFDNAGWELWASLNSLLPLLAEAAPEEFLDCVERELVDLDESLFREIFAQERSGVVGGGNYMSGVLWALETLAWHPDYLSRVSLILSDLASIDPGGNWANRPSNSLLTIFLPWHVQTCASIQTRKTVVTTVLQEHPKVGWELILGLLPHGHGVTHGSRRPTWGNYISGDWTDGVLRSEYLEQITIFTEMAVELARINIEKLGELIDRLEDLPTGAQKHLLNHLSSEVKSFAESQRVRIWEKLDALLRKHRKFSDAEWAFSAGTIAEIENVVNVLSPQAPELRFRHLFDDRDSDLFPGKENWKEQQNLLDKTRKESVETVIDVQGVSTALIFARSVASPHLVGIALGDIESDAIEIEILPSLLDSKDEIEKQVVSGFIWRRFRNRSWAWVDQVLGNDWGDVEKSSFLKFLPFEENVWRLVNDHLGHEKENLYWRTVNVDPYREDRDLTFAIEKLLKFHRPVEALVCVYRTAIDEKKPLFNADVALRSLLTVLETSDAIQRLDRYKTVEVIKRLQVSPASESEDLFKIEWNFLSWLDRFSSGSPVTLERRLATDPEFFGKVVSLVFRSNNENDPDDQEDPADEELVRHAYRLLNEWHHCPGKLLDGSFYPKEFIDWLRQARAITQGTGHGEVGQIQIGHVLAYAPTDPNGLWVHETVAFALNQRNAGPMRRGFITELFNKRGGHVYTAGKEERELARQFREKAEALEQKGYSRFATEIRKFSQSYEREADWDSKRNPFHD